MHYGNVYDTSFPLGLEETRVDTRPPDTDNLEEEQYQDRDNGRDAPLDAPRDGQEVVDYLNRKGGASPDDIGTSQTSHLPPGIFYGDLRPRKESSSIV